jgi:hypothetical protein
LKSTEDRRGDWMNRAKGRFGGLGSLAASAAMTMCERSGFEVSELTIMRGLIVFINVLFQDHGSTRVVSHRECRALCEGA